MGRRAASVFTPLPLSTIDHLSLVGEIRDTHADMSIVPASCNEVANAVRIERDQDMDNSVVPSTKAQELRAFLQLSVILAPVLAFLVVAGYGFLVWMFQLVAGPPGAKF